MHGRTHVFAQKSKSDNHKECSYNKYIIKNSELILNPDGSVYHLALLPSQVAPTIITVGDPTRVAQVSKHFDGIRFRQSKREFVTHTGWIKDLPITVMSTGMGTDNIEIAITELDALFNVNLATRKVKEQFSPLRFIRLGTSGALQADIPVDSFLASKYAVGYDGLLHFYDYTPSKQAQNLLQFLPDFPAINQPYIAAGSEELLELLAGDMRKGITLTCPGFYAPQGRSIRLTPKYSQFIHTLQNTQLGPHKLTNFEMETAGIYGMAHLLGHQAISLNAILANRVHGTFSKKPTETVERLVEGCIVALRADC